LAAAAGWRPRFIMDIINELRKVVWPSRQDTIHLTIVVVVVAIFIGALLGAIDVGFGWLISRILLR
jgi:preprotein translocase subunit SecE